MHNYFIQKLDFEITFINGKKLIETIPYNTEAYNNDRDEILQDAKDYLRIIYGKNIEVKMI